jgi:hypothetical protein
MITNSMSNISKASRQFVKTLIQFVKRKEPEKPLGRWNYSKDKLQDIKVKWTNEDHCGCCYNNHNGNNNNNTNK